MYQEIPIFDKLYLLNSHRSRGIKNIACSAYPFGMQIIERSATFATSTYRYGFNGMEKDNEVSGNSGDHLDFGARIYDSRLGRWLSTDPLESNYPSMAPYVFVENKPIAAMDEDGRDIKYRTVTDNNGNKTVFVTMNAKMINMSSDKTAFDMQELKSSVEYKAYETFSGKFTDPLGKPVNVVFKMNITVIDDLEKVGKNDHVIAIVDDVKKVYGDDVDPIGRAQLNGNVTVNESGRDNQKVTHTVVHEIAHNLGISDMYKTKDGKIVYNGGDNLMGTTGSYKLTNSQRSVMFYRYAAKGSSTTKAQRNSTDNLNTGDSKVEAKDFIDENAKTSK